MHRVLTGVRMFAALLVLASAPACGSLRVVWASTDVPVGGGGGGGGAGAPSGPPVGVTLDENSMVTLVTDDGRTLISPNRRPLVERFEGQSSVQVTPSVNGFDARIVVTNPGSAPVRLPTLHVGGIRFGRSIETFDFRGEGKPSALDHGDANYFGRGSLYPSDAYSPVLILRDTQHTIGVSLLYPVLEYEHEVRVFPLSPGGMYGFGGRNWEVQVDLMGELPAGARREYVVAVRVLPRAMPWQYTLLPYRDYFHSVYGGVRYTRDPRPILGVQVAQTVAIAPNNPRGYVGSRLDTEGWRGWADKIRLGRSNGFERVMIWTPAGLYNAPGARELNYPPQFIAPLRDMPAAHGTRHEIQSIASQGMEVGFWWGHSQWYVPTWNGTSYELLDRRKPEHVRAMLAELDYAVSLGGTSIGLDAFSYMPNWEAYRWMWTMQERYPGVRFAAEQSPPDIIHTLAAWYHDLNHISGPNLLADFLLPGHESWAGVYWNVLEAAHGRSYEAPADRRALLRQAASWGYTLVILERLMENVRDPTINAGEHWRNAPLHVLPGSGAWRQPAGGSPTSGFRSSSSLGGITSTTPGEASHVDAPAGSPSSGIVLGVEAPVDSPSGGSRPTSVPLVNTGAGGLRPAGFDSGAPVQVMGPSSAFRVSPAVPVVMGWVPDAPTAQTGSGSAHARGLGQSNTLDSNGGSGSATNAFSESTGGRAGAAAASGAGGSARSGGGGGGGGGGGSMSAMGGASASGGGGVNSVGNAGVRQTAQRGGAAMALSSVPKVVIGADNSMDSLQGVGPARGSAGEFVLGWHGGAMRERGGAWRSRSSVPVIVDRSLELPMGGPTEVVGVPTE